jgi:peptide/nickel transport system permease protein
MRFLARKLAWTIVVLWAVVTLTFCATFFSPIDPARSYAGGRATDSVVESVRERFALDKPIWVQYERYVARTARGDLGKSLNTDTPVLSSIVERLPDTAVLALAAMLVQLAVGLPLGLLAGLSARGPVDRLILAFSLFGVATPAFVLGFLLLYLFAFKLGWFPLGGSDSVSAIVLPALTLGLPGAAWYARMLRSTVINILGEDYIRMARAKGMPRRIVVLRHVLRNALSPIVAMVGIDLGVFLGGVLIIERVFAWPGIGAQTWEAVEFNDVSLVMGTVLVAAFFITMLNLIADLVNAALDPRIKRV